MIGQLTGKITQIMEKTLILDVNGVGYEVKMTQNNLAKFLPEQSTTIVIHTHVREDDITLFGFESFKERQLFHLLLTVSGIGPKSAMEILNTPLDIITNAILIGDANLLSSVQGIGKKTAEKIILELKNKEIPNFSTGSSQTLVSNDIFDALGQLGYTRHQITSGIAEIKSSGLSSEEIIKEFLKTAYTK